MDLDVIFFIDKLKRPGTAEKKFFSFTKSNLRMFSKKAFPEISE